MGQTGRAGSTNYSILCVKNLLQPLGILFYSKMQPSISYQQKTVINLPGHPVDLFTLGTIQPADIGLPTGNGKKLSCSQAQLGQATGLALA